MFTSMVFKACTDISFSSHVSPPQPQILPPAQWSPLNTFRDPGSHQRWRWREEKKKGGVWLKRTMKRHSKNVRLHKRTLKFCTRAKTPAYTSKFPCACMHSHSIALTLCAPRTTAHQAPLVVEFLRQYWSGLPFPAPGDLFNPGVKPTPPASAGRLFTTVSQLGSPKLL